MSAFKRLIHFENLLYITFLSFIVFFAFGTLNNPDMFFHIKNGQTVFNKGFEAFDSYSIHQGLTFINHEWLSDIIFFMAYSICGYTSLWIFKIIYIIFIFVLIYYILYSITDKNEILSFIGSGIITLLNTPYISIRPQIFSYAILLVEIWLLERYEKTKKTQYILGVPVLALLIINFHGAVAPLFFIIILTYFLANIFNVFKFKRVSSSGINLIENTKIFATTIFSFLFMFINPNGISTITYVFKIFKENSLFRYISELQPLNVASLQGSFLFVNFVLMMIFLIFTRNKIYLKQLFFIFGTFFMALYSYRFTSYFVIIAVLYIVQYASTIITKEFLETNWFCIRLFHKRNLICNFICLIPFVALMFMHMIQLSPSIVDLKTYPTEVVSILKSEKNLRLFNDFNYGHFLIFNDIKVFIDGRAEMYTKSVNNISAFDDFIDAAFMKKDPREIFNKYNFNYYLFDKNRPIYWYFNNNGNYIKLFENEYYVLYKNS